LARESIEHGLRTGKALKIKLDAYPPEFSEPRASFVTLERRQELRGCIGMLEAVRPLAEDVAENAFSAAFRDRRFPPLAADELSDLELHISILSAPTAIACNSEPDLLSQLRPAIDGLILAEGGHRATFLPAVWESLPSPGQFLRHLKQKAGLPADYWSDSINFYRYTTETFG
jgi:AmmeMemoRadiSam system protein A